MLKIENTQAMGWEAAIRGMRNPLLSYDRSDSRFEDETGYHDICGTCYSDEDVCDHYDDFPKPIIIGSSDKDLMKRLASAGSDHAKYRRFIGVSVDVTAPLYW